MTDGLKHRYSNGWSSKGAQCAGLSAALATFWGREEVRSLTAELLLPSRSTVRSWGILRCAR